MSEKEILNLTHDNMIEAAKIVAGLINRDFSHNINILKIYPVPRMGIPCTYLVINYIRRKFILTDSIKNCDIIIDDIVDSGATKARMIKLNPRAVFYALFNSKDYPGKWLSYPIDRGLDGKETGIETELLRLSQHTGLEIAEIKTRLGIK
jgi:hypothetical protein